MTERLEDVWISRDYPVLREVTLRIDAGDRPTLDEVRAALGFDTVTMVRATRALDRRHLVDGVRTAEHGIVRSPTSAARPTCSPACTLTITARATPSTRSSSTR